MKEEVDRIEAEAKEDEDRHINHQ